MTLFRSIFLAGLVAFFAAQQALCACAPPGTPEPVGMAMAHEMPAGHHCDETGAPEHDKSTCPHCQSGKAPLFQTAQALPGPAVLAAPATALVRLADARRTAPSTPAALVGRAYQAHAPPKRTPLQLKTRFLN